MGEFALGSFTGPNNVTESTSSRHTAPKKSNPKVPNFWQVLAASVPALPLGELGGCLGRCAKRGAKIQMCGSESDERTPKRVNERDESE